MDDNPQNENPNNDSNLKETAKEAAKGAAKEAAKKTGKQAAKQVVAVIARFAIPILLPIIAIILIIVIVAGIIHEIFVSEGTEREGDWTSVPYAASQFSTEITIDPDGTIRTSMTAQEIWDKLIESDSQVTEWLDGPEDLLKLMNAELTTKYPDTRPNPDDPIDWDKINSDVESNATQGIIKFRRAQNDGSQITLTYVDPDTFYGWVEEYNMTGSESAKNNALTHFTMTKSPTFSNLGGASLDYNGKDIITDISERIIAATKTTGFAGDGKCQAWVRKVYANAGLGNVYFNTAYEAAKANIISTDVNNIPVGAAVYATGTGPAGHVGIYIGNGQVMDNITGGLRVTTLEKWIAEAERLNYPLDGKVGWLGWGWQAGQPTQIISQEEPDDENESTNTTDQDATEGDTGEIDDEEAQEAADEYISQKLSLDDVLFIGDSITVGLSQLLPNSTVVAEVGSTPSQWVPGSSNWNKLPEDSDAIKAVCIMLGVNSPTQTEQMKQLIDALVSKYPGKTIYVQKVLPVTVKYHYNDYNAMNDYIDAYNSEIEAFCNGKTNVKFIDTSTGYVNSDGSGIVSLFDNEGLHPLDYQQLKENIEKAINGISGSANEANQSTFSSDYQVVVATWNETEVKVTSNDPQADTTGSKTQSMSTSKVDYQTMVSGYTMPFNYLWAFIVIGQDKNFAMDLADLVFGSEIVFTVFDNLTVTVNENTENYTRNITINTSEGPKTETRSYYRTTTTTYRTNTIQTKLTYANVWIVEYSQEFTREGTENGGNRYVESPPNIREKTDPEADEDNFVTLFNKWDNRGTTSNIVSGAEWLIDILERNEDTSNTFPDLTRYLIYKATGKDLGVTEFDFSAFDPKNFQSVSVTIEGGNVQEKVWNALRAQGFSEYAVAGAMGNIQHESGFNNNSIEGGYTEYNGGIGICQWTNYPRTNTVGSGARNQRLKDYAASKGTTWQDVDTQIEFLITELNGGVGPAQGFAVNQLLNYRGYNGDSWRNASSPEDAAVAFCWSFERPGSPNLSARQQSARQYYEMYKGTSANTNNDEQTETEEE